MKMGISEDIEISKINFVWYADDQAAIQFSATAPDGEQIDNLPSRHTKAASTLLNMLHPNLHVHNCDMEYNQLPLKGDYTLEQLKEFGYPISDES